MSCKWHCKDDFQRPVSYNHSCSMKDSRFDCYLKKKIKKNPRAAFVEVAVVGTRLNL